MLGAIVGDVIGSVFESAPTKTLDFPLFQPRSRFTDDTVMTVATAWAILNGQSYDDVYREFGRRYPRAGYGKAFRAWFIEDDAGPYGSYGNGSAMRVSPVAWAFDDDAAVLREAERTAAVTHDHVEGIKGAQAVALAVFRARRGDSKDAIRSEIESRFGYDLQRSIDDIRPSYCFDVSCQASVPEALIAFLDGDGVEGAIRLAISLGGDSDTQAAIAASVAHAFYGEVPEPLTAPVRERLPQEFLAVIDAFQARYSTGVKRSRSDP
jgi:ADP-ribosylglycohydrolase